MVDVRRRLSKGGVLFMQIPNAGSLAARIMREKCNVFDGLEHVNLYSPATLARTADRAGFQVVSVASVIDELKPIWNYLNYDDPYAGAFVESQDLKFLSPQLIQEHLLGYKLQVVLIPV